MKNFALIGAGGYIAPRHMKAIKETGNDLVCAIDRNDSVGILDSHFPDASFFVEFERFDRHVDKLRRAGKSKVDYVSICTPNYLHDSQIRFALRSEAHAICEKPLVLNPWNIDALHEYEMEYGHKIFTILQLRLHPSIIDLKQKIDADTSGKIHDVDLNYITSRGRWYFTSWKADETKSGGIATNIGVHFFDMLTYIFGPMKNLVVHLYENNKAAGFLELERARVRWFMSVDYNDIPAEVKAKGARTYRTIRVDDSDFEFSEGFTNLHTLSYEKILKNEGFGVCEAKQSIEIVHQIRHAKPVGLVSDFHPYLKQIAPNKAQGGISGRMHFFKDC